MVRFRSIVLAGIGIVALAFAYILPSSAEMRDPGVYGIGFAPGAYYVPANFDVAPRPAAVVPSDPVAIRPDRPRAAAALGPIYALSLETHGQSLRAFHMRC